MKLGKLAQGSRRVDVDVVGSEEKVGVVYRPMVLTSDNVARMVDESTPESETREILSELLESWEIENNDGSPLGTDPESLGKIPLEFLGAVIETIVRKDATVPESNGGASSAT